MWLCGGAEPVEVVVGEKEEEKEETAPAAAAPLLSPAVAALLAPRTIDPWLSERFSAVRCGPLRVGGALAGAAASLAELCGDGDDPGDAAFVVVECSGSSAPSPPPLVLLAGDGPAPLSSSLLAPLLARPHASPPPPASLARGSDNAPGRLRPPPAPTAVFEPGSGPSYRSQELVLDAVALYPKTATAGEAAAALRVALSRQLRAAMATSGTAPLRASPFLLPGLPVFVTPLMPSSKRRTTKKKAGAEQATSSSSSSASAAAAARASLGAALRLPPGLPLLRPSAAFVFSGKGSGRSRRSAAGAGEQKLLDVHRFLPSFSSSNSSSFPFDPPPLPKTPSLSCACVAGPYRYHHYGQDSKDDKGWGCAYRSLQTLWSWFAENHFLSDDDDDSDGDEEEEEFDGKKGRQRPKSKKTPPTHEEIQRALVSLGDKPATFVGSSQWIGALEISFALYQLAGIQSKVVPVARGAEMATAAAAGALVAHFRSQGTPVMVGGGVLAYTCLGCAYDAESGEASFLILDPHYCGRTTTSDGASDPAAAAAAAAAAVVKGGWVAWKRPGDSAAAGGPLFLDDAFYNLLCPQRPERV